MTDAAPINSTQLAAMQEAFVRHLPKIRRVARFRLRHLSEEQKEEEVAETIALAWKAFRHLCEQGRDPNPLIGKIAEFSARRVNCGARLAGRQPVTDVMSRTSQHRHGHSIQSFSADAEAPVDPELMAALRDRKAVSPADQAAFNLDLEAFLKGLDDRGRDVAEGLASGLNTVEVSNRRGESRAVVSYHRARLRRAWDEFNGEGPQR